MRTRSLVPSFTTSRQLDGPRRSLVRRVYASTELVWKRWPGRLLHGASVIRLAAPLLSSTSRQMPAPKRTVVSCTAEPPAGTVTHCCASPPVHVTSRRES